MKKASEILSEELTKNMVKALIDIPHFEEFIIDAMCHYADTQLIDAYNEIERLKGIASGKTFHDETEVLKLQVKDLEEHNEDIRNDYRIAMKILRTTYSDNDISILWKKI